MTHFNHTLVNLSIDHCNERDDHFMTKLWVRIGKLPALCLKIRTYAQVLPYLGDGRCQIAITRYHLTGDNFS